MKQDHLTMMTSAYDLLLKYVINLLKPKRPQVWRTIKTNNTAFRARVDCMEGARGILKTVGYTVETPTTLQFPETTVEPDRERLCAVAAELLMAKLEVEDKNTQQSSGPTPQHVLHTTPVSSVQPSLPMAARTERFTPQNQYTAEPMKHERQSHDYGETDQMEGGTQDWQRQVGNGSPSSQSLPQQPTV